MYLFNYWIQFDEDNNDIIINKFLFSYIFNIVFTITSILIFKPNKITFSYLTNIAWLG